MAYIEIPQKLIDEAIQKEVEKQLNSSGLMRYLRDIIHAEVKKKVLPIENMFQKLNGRIVGLKKTLDSIKKKED